MGTKRLTENKKTKHLLVRWSLVKVKISRFSIIVSKGGEAGLPIIGMLGMFSTFFFII
jgi:hypothetical protein